MQASLSNQSTAPARKQPEPRRMAQVIDMAITPNGQPEYLSYAPTPHLAADRTNQCYRAFLDRLGFKPEDDPDAKEVRLRFIKDVRAHICVPETMFLRKEDNPPAFEALVQGFLSAYGSKYWDSRFREHLVVSDPSKGFLHPRDSVRMNSRYVLASKYLVLR